MKEPLFYRFIAKPLIVVLIRVFYRPKVIGIEKIPKTGRIILAGNHTNNLDSVMISAINKRVVHFLAKDSLLKGPQKIIFKHMGIIPVNRSVHDKDALKKAIYALNEGKGVARINKVSSAENIPAKAHDYFDSVGIKVDGINPAMNVKNIDSATIARATRGFNAHRFKTIPAFQLIIILIGIDRI